jgi:hypothetical protein
LTFEHSFKGRGIMAQHESPRKLYEAIQQDVDDSNRWICQLFFSVSETPELQSSFRKEDLMSYISAEHEGKFFYFDPTKYPSTNKFSRDSSWPQLLLDLQAAARAGGYELQSNGGDENRRVLRCPRGETYKAKRPPVPGVYKNVTLHNNRNTTRGPGGKSMPCLTTTKKPDTDHICKMRFSVNSDEKGYYFAYHGKRSSASAEHQFHANLHEVKLPQRLKHVDAAEKALFGDVRQAAASAAVAANLFMVRTGTFIDERQIRYVNAMAECVPTGSDGLPTYTAGDGTDMRRA